MNSKMPSPEARNIALRLLASEAAAGDRSEENTPPAFRVSEKLRRPLSTLTGASAFRVLLARALTMAKVHAPSLNAVQIKLDGSLDGLSEIHSEKAQEGGAMLIAQLIGLLFEFIGESLTLHMVLDVWPELSGSDAEVYKGANEYGAAS
jgi:hypothetical protein